MSTATDAWVVQILDRSGTELKMTMDRCSRKGIPKAEEFHQRTRIYRKVSIKNCRTEKYITSDHQCTRLSSEQIRHRWKEDRGFGRQKRQKERESGKEEENEVFKRSMPLENSSSRLISALISKPLMLQSTHAILHKSTLAGCVKMCGTLLKLCSKGGLKAANNLYDNVHKQYIILYSLLKPFFPSGSVFPESCQAY